MEDDIDLEAKGTTDTPQQHPAQQWLNERIQPGNWIRIAPDEEIPPVLAGPFVTLVHMFQIAFTPEIERRIAAGQIDDGFFLHSAQLIIPETGPQMIRLNDEIRGVLRVRVDRPIQKGDPVSVSDLKDVESFDVDESELDCGHFTMFYEPDGWRVFFNFQAGRAKSMSAIKLAEQFLEAAKYSTEQGHGGPAVDNLFSACELLSKARLILHRDNAVRSKTHGAISSAINSWGKLGNVDAGFVRLFNRLSNARGNARYNPGDNAEPPAAEDLEVVSKEIELLSRVVEHRR